VMQGAHTEYSLMGVISEGAELPPFPGACKAES
jgi:hypothetical protein